MESKTLGWALSKLREGRRVCRSGWNDKNMFLELVPAEQWASEVCVAAERSPFPIAMKTADSKWVPWLASQSDMLSEDWEEVE